MYITEVGVLVLRAMYACHVQHSLSVVCMLLHRFSVVCMLLTCFITIICGVQLELQAMLPWSLGMKPWFIDPKKLTPSSDTLGQNTHAVVYSGTYNRDKSSPALKVRLLLCAMNCHTVDINQI